MEPSDDDTLPTANRASNGNGAHRGVQAGGDHADNDVEPLAEIGLARLVRFLYPPEPVPPDLVQQLESAVPSFTLRPDTEDEVTKRRREKACRIYERAVRAVLEPCPAFDDWLDAAVPRGPTLRKRRQLVIEAVRARSNHAAARQMLRHADPAFRHWPRAWPKEMVVKARRFNAADWPAVGYFDSTRLMGYWQDRAKGERIEIRQLNAERQPAALRESKAALQAAEAHSIKWAEHQKRHNSESEILRNKVWKPARAKLEQAEAEGQRAALRKAKTQLRAADDQFEALRVRFLDEWEASLFELLDSVNESPGGAGKRGVASVCAELSLTFGAFGDEKNEGETWSDACTRIAKMYSKLDEKQRVQRPDKK